jgi:cytochrome c-type biogenesis protein
MLTMGVFALGAAASLLLAGFVVARLAKNSKALTRQSARIGRIVFGGVLVVVGLAALTGIDRIIEASLVQIMPEWLVLFATQV